MTDKLKHAVSFIWDFTCNVLIIGVIVLILATTYWAWFSWGGHPIENKEISIKIISSKDPSVILQNNKQILELQQILKQIEDSQLQNKKFTQSQSRENRLTVSTLNGFYASLFTALAAIIAILGLSVWKTKFNLEKKLKELEEIDKKVKFLHEKKELAEWARNLFDNDKNDISSNVLYLSPEDKEKMERTKKYMMEQIADDSWLGIVLAKELVKNDLKKALKVFKYIENRDLLDEESKIEPVLYHLTGQAYMEQYKGLKKDKKEKEAIKSLNDSIEYYEKALTCDEKRDETLGNLAVGLIELTSENLTNEVAKTIKKAKGHLNKVITLKKATFNTYYDLARSEYIESKDIEKVKEYLFKAVEKINTIKQKDRFIDFIEEDEQLKEIENWDILKETLIDKINNKKWLDGIFFKKWFK